MSNNLTIQEAGKVADLLAEGCRQSIEEILNQYDAYLVAREGADIEIIVYQDDATGKPIKGSAYLSIDY